MRIIVLVILGLALGGLLKPATPLLVWNATASAPRGLYRLTDLSPFHRGDLVVATLPEPVQALAARRGYLALHVPIIKPIAALAGDCVCGSGAEIRINGKWVALRWVRDMRGRPLPFWHGCQRLGPDKVFLLNPNVPASFDGRYFGAIGRSAVLGKLTPLWLL